MPTYLTDNAANKFKPSQSDPLCMLKNAHQKLRQAEGLRSKGNLESAERMCRSLLRQYPDYFGALHTMGLVCGELKKTREAIGFLVQACIVNPDSWATLTALAGEYLNMGAKESAARTLRDALEIKPNEPSILVTLANLYLEQRRYLEALIACRKALAQDSGLAEANLAGAKACIELGKLSEAASYLRQKLNLGPPDLTTLILITSLPGTLLEVDLHNELDRVVFKREPDDGTKETCMSFIRSKAFARVGDHKRAWKLALSANQLVQNVLQDQIAVEVNSTVQRLEWVKKNAQKLTKIPAPNKALPKTAFIFGLSRSGKTTLESLLGSQIDVKRGYENTAISNAVRYAFQTGGFITQQSIGQLPSHMYKAVGEKYHRTISELMDGEKIFTSTAPGHIWEAPFFLQSIPNSKYVFVKRDSRDLMLRIFFKHYKSGNTYSYDLHQLQRYIKLYNDMIDTLVEIFPDHSMVVQYEDMVADPKKTLGDLCEFCGITPDYSLLPEIGSDVGCSEPYAELIEAALAQSDQKAVA